MKLFSEQVIHTFTNSTHNILQVENFNEIFFDVFEVEINKSKYPVEKISEYEGNPVVSVPVISEGIEVLFPFVLIQGTFGVFFNEKNTMEALYPGESSEKLNVKVSEEADPIPLKELNESLKIEYVELVDKKDIILKQISEAKEKAKKTSEAHFKKVLDESRKKIRKNNESLKNTLNAARENLVQEFINVSGKIKDELFENSNTQYSEIKQTIDNKIQELADSLRESLNTNFKDSSKIFDSKIKTLVKELYTTSILPKVDKELKDIAQQIVEKVDGIETNLNSKVENKVDKDVLVEFNSNFNSKIENVQKRNIELHDVINKGVNKALSRVGNVSTKVDELTIALTEEVEKVEKNVMNYYDEKLQMLEEKTFDITEDTRRYIVGLVQESRNNLIEELRKIKNEKPIEYIVESKGKKETKDFDTIQKDIIKELSGKVDSEVTRLRRYISVYSGGGSVAMQFADGGTMNGNLTVVGSISAAQYLGLPMSTEADTFDTVTSRGNTTNNSIIVSSISAGSYLNLPYVNPVKTTLTGNGTLSTFAIPGADTLINPSAITVSIDGAIQEPVVDYSVLSGSIIFTQPLPNGSKAVVISPNCPTSIYSTIPTDGSVTTQKLATDLSLYGGVTINSLGATSTPLTINGYSGQANDYLNIKNSGGSTVMKVTSGGTLNIAQNQHTNAFTISGYDTQSSIYLNVGISSIGRSTFTSNGALVFLGSSNIFGPSYITTFDLKAGSGSYFQVRNSSFVDIFRVKEDGNVGIGTSTPNEKLTVVGNISATGNITTTTLSAIGSSATTVPLMVKGVSNQTADLLTIINPISSTTYAKFNATGGLAIRDEDTVGGIGKVLLQLRGPYGSTDFYGSFFNIQNINLNTANNLYIGRGGGGLAVGSYMGSIASKFTVTGNAAIGTNYVLSAAPTNGLLVEGNVGMGTTTPNEKLTVVGNISATGTLAVSSISAPTGDLTINTLSGKTLVLSQPVWDDVNFPIIIRNTGAGIPTMTTFNGRITKPEWQVNDFNQTDSNEFPHSWMEGSTCHWHAHFDTNGTDVTNRYVKFELEYAYSVNGVWTFPAVVTTADLLIPANTPSKTQIIFSLASFTPTGSKIGDHCIAYLKRIASTGTAPTGNPWIPMLQMHIQKDSLGSRQMTSK